MERLVLAVVLFFGCLATVAGGVSGQPNQAASDKQHDADSRTQAVLASDHKSAAQDTGETNDDPPHWYTPLKRPEWALVIVGLGAVIVAWRTLSAINRQVTTFISKERGRLAVELEPLKLRSVNELSEAVLLVTNHGSTNVFVGEALCLPLVESSKWNPVNTQLHLVMAIPKVIAPDKTAPGFRAPIQAQEKLSPDAWDIGQKTIEEIVSGKKSVFVLGRIDYEDVFGNKWRLRFCRRWRRLFTVENGDWLDYGTAEENAECQIKRPSKLWERVRRRFPQPKFS
jgi:hypothetical protein